MTTAAPPPPGAAPRTPPAPAAATTRRLGVPQLLAAKGGTPLVVLTCYTASMARLLDPHVDVLLVGDSLGMVVYGLDDTLAVTLDLMIAHGAAVARGSARAMVVVDLPFGSYQESPAQAYRAAARVLAESGAGAVKLEGGAEMAATIAFLAARGIPVMGHVGMLPQTHLALGGFRVQGRDAASRARVLADARAVAEAGAFALVLEAVVADLAPEVTAAVPVPVIGIGASAACDGQVLVIDDMLGLHDGRVPRFVHPFAQLHPQISAAAAAYAAAVRARQFPAEAQTYVVPHAPPVA